MGMNVYDGLTKFIDDTFSENPEVFEVAMYAIASITIEDEVIRGLMSRSNEVKNINPKALRLMKRFSDGTVRNDFWLKNYAPLKSQLALSNIKANTLSMYIGYGEDKKDVNAFEQARALLLARFDALTMIAFLWKGIEFAEKFDFEFRLPIQLTKEHKDYFAERGL